MKKTLLLKSSLVIAGTALLLTGCVIHEPAPYYHPTVVAVAPVPSSGVIYVNSGPPAPLVDTVVVAPGPGYVWIRGAWAWDRRWMWRTGYWVRPPRPGAVWIQPYYGYRGGHHVWHRGYWR